MTKISMSKLTFAVQLDVLPSVAVDKCISYAVWALQKEQKVDIRYDNAENQGNENIHEHEEERVFDKGPPGV